MKRLPAGQFFRLRRTSSALIVVAVLLSGSTALAAPSSDYRFVLIAEGGGPVFSTFGNSPSLNEHGTVAFTTILSSNSKYAIYTGDGNTTTKVIDALHPIFAGGGPVTIENYPSINDSGVVAFGAFAGVPGVLTSDGVTATSIYQPTVSIAPTLNNAGAVAFKLSVGSGRQGIAVAQ